MPALVSTKLWSSKGRGKSVHSAAISCPLCPSMEATSSQSCRGGVFSLEAEAVASRHESRFVIVSFWYRVLSLNLQNLLGSILKKLKEAESLQRVLFQPRPWGYLTVRYYTKKKTVAFKKGKKSQDYRNQFASLKNSFTVKHRVVKHEQTMQTVIALLCRVMGTH